MVDEYNTITEYKKVKNEIEKALLLFKPRLSGLKEKLLALSTLPDTDFIINKAMIENVVGITERLNRALGLL